MKMGVGGYKIWGGWVRLLNYDLKTNTVGIGGGSGKFRGWVWGGGGG